MAAECFLDDYISNVRLPKLHKEIKHITKKLATEQDKLSEADVQAIVKLQVVVTLTLRQIDNSLSQYLIMLQST